MILYMKMDVFWDDLPVLWCIWHEVLWNIHGIIVDVIVATLKCIGLDGLSEDFFFNIYQSIFLVLFCYYHLRISFSITETSYIYLICEDST